jgi:hypothetical protein
MDKNAKKRGRKPKGGKLLDPPDETEELAQVLVQNIILHLKCRSRDLASELSEAVVEPYCTETAFADVPTAVPAKDSVQTKLRDLAAQLHINDAAKRSDCFWCTCAFDTTPVFLPKARTVAGKFQVYGCFCCPECAAAYLFQEPRLDYAVRFERYHLLNYLYGAAYGYKKSILLAPAPHYLLEKFYGTLTIEEYRAVVRSTPVVVMDKPISLQFPEIGETMDVTLPTNPGAASSAASAPTPGYRLCRKKTKVATS